MSTGLVLAEDLRAHLLPAREIEAREQRARLSTGTALLDEVLGGGWPRGTLCEVRGGRGQGRTAIMLASLGAALRAGEAAALIDFCGNFDPAPAVRAGVSLERLLWVRGPSRPAEAGSNELRGGAARRRESPASLAAHRTPERLLIAATEAIVAAGGFGVVALDFGEQSPMIPTAAWLRLRRLVAAPGTVLLVSTSRAPANLFGATSLCLEGGHPVFGQPAHPTIASPPALLESVEIHARRARMASGAESATSKSSSSALGAQARLVLVHHAT